jgi:hypothetical protein
LANRNAADALLFRMGNDGDIVRLKRGLYCLPNVAGSYASHDQRKKRKKVRSEFKPLKEQQDNPPSYDLTHLTQDAGGVRKSPLDDYLGPEGDDPADFLGDIPGFLRRT